MTLVPPLWGDKTVEPARDDETERGDDESAVCEREAIDVDRVLALAVEVGIGERVYDGEYRPGNIAQQRCPPERQRPVAVGANDHVEIRSELVALRYAKLAIRRVFPSKAGTVLTE